MVNALIRLAEVSNQESISFEPFVFWICGGLAVIGAIGMLISHKAVHSALWVALTMMNLAVLYVVQSAPFLGVTQVVVYTGAVMMLFLFVLMIVGVDASDSLVETIKGQRRIGILAGVVLVSALVLLLGNSFSIQSAQLSDADSIYGGNVQGIAALLFGKYVLIFELTSALLITAALGAMILAHKERTSPRKTQANMAKELFASGNYQGPLPSPGVYARHNSVDTPALLPDGSVSEISIPGPIVARGVTKKINQSDLNEVQIISEGLGLVSSEEDDKQ
ncbi:MAG: NADH-quinone oxidoreductase subunit J [Candidatus Nanopelagicales bacterium]|jgi:NADH-quinone oxidoreductase subunit J|nr:NADH-quinone oxidoreductase subunit J [Candidatus Nanopelagicales bacterium]